MCVRLEGWSLKVRQGGGAGGGVGGVALGEDCVWCHFAGPSALTWNRALPLPESYQFPEEIPAAGKHDPSTPRPSTLPRSQRSLSWSLSQPKSTD